ncbi:GIY-YIG nuclease family protein [Natronincola ferrireducens]|uniref:Putative endonuclease n=1 Tax=Natronincola ferrireducens TaxID=393762 RepID=A0A1G8ZEP1_9FIRM|nr:GIY-YIG nuclease family protein [Natronincola ferrireducens]SDK13521.1 putative endonuclease [Natronincola ferrireducens]
MAYTYILECNDSTFYIGWTTDLENRVKVHNEGKGARYTRGRRPVKLLYWESHDNRSEAQKREAALRRLNRREKEELINKFTKKLINIQE